MNDTAFHMFGLKVEKLNIPYQFFFSDGETEEVAPVRLFRDI